MGSWPDGTPAALPDDMPSDPVREPRHEDFEELRRHVEPVARSAAERTSQPVASSDDPRVSVMEWLLDVGHSVARRFRSASPLLRAHER
jgi:hypothetical protein